MPLRKLCQHQVKHCVLMGKDAQLLADAIGGVTPITYAVDMKSAVQSASRVAEAGDVVLLSPACASFDMFENYEQRGESFVAAVGELAQ